MAQEPEKTGGTEQEWGKLSPAIQPSAADSLLSARRKESGIPVDPPLASKVTAPWTAPVPTVPSPLPDAAAAEEGEEPLAPAETAEQGADAPAVAEDEAAPVATILDTENEASERAEARELAVEDRPRWLGFRKFLIAVAVPVATIMLAIRLVATNGFLWLEYHRPGFPADSYGFDTQERLRLGSYGLEYVLNFAPHTYLSEIQTGGTTAFLASEVEHMTDVKRVMLVALTATVLLLLSALLAGRTLRTRAPGAIRKSVFTGAWLTLGLILALGVGGLLGWEAFFTAFHNVFFPQGNWQFRMSDTLIRLYPPQFWVDAALVVAAVILLVTVTLLALTWPTKYRKQLALARRAERLELKKMLSR